MKSGKTSNKSSLRWKGKSSKELRYVRKTERNRIVLTETLSVTYSFNPPHTALPNIVSFQFEDQCFSNE